jgi:hypothetical protein
MKNHDHLLEFAKKELALINFDQSDINEPMLAFLEQNSKMCNNDPESMKKIINLLNRVVDRLPLSAITEEDFEPEHHLEEDTTVTIYRCTRYPHVYKINGQYYDDRAVSFKFSDNSETDTMYIYQSENSSKQEINIPYYPNPVVKVITRDNLSTVGTKEVTLQDAEPDYEVE